MNARKRHRIFGCDAVLIFACIFMIDMKYGSDGMPLCKKL